MGMDRLSAIGELALYVADVVLVLACCVVHFNRGEVGDGNLYGGLTVGVFITAGFITNTFNFFRHELQRMNQLSWWNKVMKLIVAVILPSSSLLAWSLERVKEPLSWMPNYWTATLRLFYSTTGSFTQAFLQGYIVTSLWWTDGIAENDFLVMIVAAISFALHSVIGVSAFIWKEFYELEHDTPPIWDFGAIFIAVLFNMCGRVVSMTVVAATVSLTWMVVAVMSPFTVNYAVYLTSIMKDTKHTSKNPIYTCLRYCFPIPISLLSAMSLSKEKLITFLTTVIWICCSLPYISRHNDTWTYWMVWGVPVAAQVIALVLTLIKWDIFKMTFERYSRMVIVNQFTKTIMDQESKA